MNQVWKIGLIVGLAVLVLTTGVGIKSLLNKRASESGWKMYKNSEMGFEISYPDNWVLGVSENEISSNEKEVYFSLNSQERINSAPQDRMPLCQICIAIWNYTDKAWSNLKNQKPAQIDGINGYEGMQPGIENSYVTAVERDGFTYIVGSFFQELDETEKLIKDSFKFLKP